MRTLIDMMAQAIEIRSEVALKLQAAGRIEDARRVATCVVSWAPRMDKCAGKAFFSLSRGGKVRLSKPIYSIPENQFDFRETVLHEFAHIASVGDHHGSHWKSTYVSFGGNGSIKHNLKTLPYRRNPRVSCRCSECGRQVQLGPAQAWAAQHMKRNYWCLAVVNHETFDATGVRTSFNKHCGGYFLPPFGWTYGAMNAARKAAK